MSDISERLAQLSPERRAILQKVLQERMVARAAPQEIRRRSAEGPLPLSFAQRRLWLVEQMDPGSATYNVPLPLRVRGPLDAGALRRALEEVVRRHEVLRTRFATVEGGEPVQVVDPPAPVPLPVVDLGGVGEAEREALRWVVEDTLRPFDLERGPLLRALLLRLGREEHVFLLDLHHIVSDGWSMGVLTRELSALYAAFAAGDPSPLPELPVQYGDHAAWQREHLAGEELERQLAWWKEHLAGAPPVLGLPTDRPRTPMRGSTVAGLPLALSAELSRALRDLAQREGATPFMLFLAAWQLFLSRYAGGEDVVVGTPIAGRTRREVEPLIGFFVNTLAIRGDLSGDPGFRTLLGRVREATLGAFAHQDLPFEKLVEELRVERSLTHTPVFQAMFALEDARDPGTVLRLGDAEGEPLELGSAPAKVDLSLGIFDHGDALKGVLAYRTDLWERATAERMLAHFLRLLEAVATDPAAPVSTLDLLSADERARVVGEWSAAPAPECTLPVHLAVAAQAARTPGAVALEWAGGSVTYAELEESTGRLARRLRERGVARGNRVGLFFERTPELVVSVLAVLRAGGVYVPLDPGFPAERLSHALRDSGACLLLGHSALRERLPATHTPVLLVDELPPGGEALPPVEVDPRDGAYVIYTSGSTGTPKGVKVEHGSLANTLHGAAEAFPLAPGAVMPSLASPAFDIWGFELFLPLLQGAAVRLLPSERVRDVAALAAELESVDAVHAVPALMREVVRQVRAGPGTLPRVRRLFVGGDAVAPDLLEEVREAFPAAAVHVLYGPTEGTIICASHLLSAEGVRGQMIGRPLPGTALHVLDAGGNPLPVGVPGELCIGGAGVARGYLGRAELTAEKWVPDPFGAPGARLYRTGDRARRDPDGALEFLGRMDAQVKIRGYRIEPGEVEAVLGSHPGVREAAVAVREDAGERRLVGYAVPAEGMTPTAAELREHLRMRLPEYMVPGALVLLDALPLTPTGKLDRSLLPAPEREEGGHVAPRTPTEEVLAGLWSEVLGVERVGAEDHFFELGGHSLLATRVVSRVREAFGVELPVRALFEHPFLAGLAARVDALARGGGAAQLPPIMRAPRDRPLPLSFAQRRLWLIEEMEPGTALYNLPFPLRLRGALDAGALRRALEEVVLRHEALRTTFAAAGDEPVQVVAPAADVPLPVVDLSGLAPEAREAEALKLAEAEVLRTFDLARGPLLRATLLRLETAEHALLLDMHHIVSDGWSMGVFTRELSALYAAFAEGRPSPLAPLPFQYADFAVWQRGWLTGDELERQLAWWREHLAGAPPLLELPTDRPRSAVRDARGERRSFVVGAETGRALRALSRREGTTLFMTFLAAFQALLSRYSGQDDVVVGGPIAGRTHLELERLVGFFVNTLALRTDLSGEPGFAELLGRVRDTTLGAYAHQDVPFERLVEEMVVERSLTHTPLFQVVLSLQNLDRAELRLGGVAAEPLRTGRLSARFDMVLTLAEDGDAVQGGLVYRADLWDGATIERMLDHFRRFVEGVAADPARRVTDVPLLGPEERAQVVEGWNATGAEYPSRPVHLLVSEQAARTPEAVAVAFGEEQITFAVLEERSNRLAHHLAALGVGPDARVGLLLERGVELVVAVLAILKAGGAYVALDPSTPDERLLFVLRDAEARALLTDAALAERVPAFAGAVVRLDADREEIASRSAALPGVEVSARNLAYAIYTSGSTGTPKGVLIEHGGLSNYLAFFDREVLGAEGFALPLVSRLSFDAHVRQLYPPLLRGEPVWVLPEESVGDPVRLLEALGSRERVSFGGVPSLWSAVLDALDAGEHPAPEGLRAVLLGGEALPAELARRTRARFPGVRLWNHYGPTEATVNTTVACVADPERVNLGRPVANVRVYLLDGGMQPVPVGVPGELYVGGVGVSRGYLGRPELTAERYLPDPFSAEPGARLYRSGDRVRRLASGELEYLGRVDQQVKVRGFRIEPGEVEAALLRHPFVREAAVAAREDAPGQARLVGYVVALEGTVLLSAELKAYLAGRLPEYMVPSAWVVMDALPLSRNGKVDRAALPAPDEAEEGDGYLAPRTPAEEMLAGIVGAVLLRERVGVHDDFFALGGHSLAATSVISRVRRAFGVEVPLRAIFEAPTVAGLAERVEALLHDGAGVALPPVARAPRDGALPLSFAQQRLWFIEQMDPGAALYSLSFPSRLRGALEVPALRRALGEVVRRHEVLRTRFLEADGRPVQVVDPPAPFPLPCVDLRGLPEEARLAEARRLAAAEVGHRFDLRRGPLLRVTLLQLGEADRVMLLNVHHIVFDGWSTGVFNVELSLLYAAYLRREEARLPVLPFQYADYAVWQREWLQGPVLEEQLAYWRGRLAGAPPLLELPTDRPRPAVRGAHASRVPFLFPEETTRGIYAVAREEGATLFMALLAAWQVLLARYAGVDDVVVGAPIAGRRRTETEPLVGFFVNTLALRTDLSGDPSFRALLARVREATLGAYTHQDLPFERLVEELGVERSLAHSPLFQVMFAVQNHQRTALRLEGLRLEPFPVRADTARTDLGMTVVEGEERLGGMLTYRTDLWDAATIGRMLDHFGRLLEGIAAAPEARLSELSFLGDDERRQVVEGWNATEAPYPSGACLHELVERHAEHTPDAVALLHGDERVSYAELNARANRLAHHLRELGVGPEARVALLLEPAPETIMGLLAVLKAGGAYVPLDPANPEERLRYLLRDSAPAAVLTQHALAPALPDGGVPVLRVDAHAAAWAGRSAENPERGGLTPDHLAYVIYTSGSTGTPKGVLVPHRGVVNAVEAFRAVYRIRPESRVLLFAPLHFDASVLDVFTALASGAALVTAPREELIPGEELIGLLARQRVTHAKFTPSALAALPDAELPELEAVMSGGETCPAEVVRRWAPGRRFYNGYGPTETSVRVSVVETADATRLPPIGRAVANVRLYVLDAALEPVPVGVPGELCVGGVQVARGYLGRPELTAASWVPDPFGAEPGGRLYRTGDRVRWNADGTLGFLGRSDHQVKVRGLRIELGEIEARLSAHAAVRDAVVLAREDAPGVQRLVAYYVGEERAVGAEELRSHLMAALPEYMVPAAYVRLDALPLTPSGKVDRRALPAPEWGGTEEAYVAPRTPTEELLAGIWVEVLGVERVGATDDFFALGGHSLLATRVVSRAKAALGVELPLRALFEAPTVAGLAARAEAALRESAGVRVPPIARVPRDGALPLSYAQRRLWFLDRLEPGGGAYSMPFALRLEGPLDARALEGALAELVRRHEALRTVFPAVEGEPVQVVEPAEPRPLPRVDLRGLGEGAREEEARRLAREDAARPFDLARGPVLRSALVLAGEEDHALLLNMHHIVSDGWSMGVLLREVSALYRAFREGRPSPLAELEVQYADYAAWQREWLAGPVLEAQMGYWRERLRGLEGHLELPLDHPRPAVQSFAGDARGMPLGPELSAKLEALSRREGVTLYMLLLAALQVLLSRYAGEDDLAVGSPIAGRGAKEVEGLIGFFVNTLVLRTRVRGEEPFRALLERVREAALDAYAHQDVPFERLVEEVQPERSLAHTPLFQVMFSFQNAREAAAEPDAFLSGELRLRPQEGRSPVAKFDQSWTVVPAGDGLDVGLVYSRDLFEAETIERMLGHYRRLLEQVVEDAGRAVSSLELLDEAERARVLEEWNDTAAPLPELPVHALFAAQAARAPEALAVASGEERLTYAELDALSSRLAHLLREHGVGAEDRVALLLPRGLEPVVCALGVLRAGAAYVSLDASLPAERLRYMVEDSGARLALAADSVPELESAVPVLRWSAVRASLPSCPASAPAVEIHTGQLAYLIYTSGSTGRPKGVMVPHEGLANLAHWHVRAYGLGPGDRATLLAGLGFDASVWEVWPALVSGASLHVVPDEARTAPGALRDFLAEHGVTTAFVPTVLAEPLLRLPWPEGALRLLLTGGDRLTGRPGEELPFAVVNHYGPTENTVVATAAPVSPGEGAPPIGRPIANVRAYVLDEALQPVPVGVPGELYVAGAGVARGYVGRARETAAAFLPDPFGAPGGRMYRTGDRVRRLASGELAFLGRVDRQVKVRGFRIEPGEIEAVLLGHPEVREAAVVAREDAPGDRRLVGYFVGDASPAELRSHLSERLPEYMVPATFVRLDALPLTPNGKLDRRALPAPEGDAPGTGGYEAPLGEVEEALAEIWSEVLGVARVGRRDNFFELGGHSLLAVTLIERMRRRGLHADVRALFTTPTLADLAAEVGGETREVQVPPNGVPTPCAAITPEMLPLVELSQEEIDAVVAGVPGGAGNVQDVYPLAPLQEGILFHYLMASEGDPYLVANLFAFDTRARLDAFVGALRAVVARHDILRTSVAWEGLPEPVQVVWREASLAVEEVELDPAEGDVPEQLYERFGPRRYRLDVRQAPMLRVCIAYDAPRERWAFLLLMHHLAGDHTTLDVLRGEIEAHLQGRAEELPTPLPFRSYVAQARLGVGRAEHEAFFRKLLGDVDEPTAPFGLLDVQGDGSGVAEARVIVDEDLSLRLRESARKLGVSAASVCHLAWAQVLARVSGREDVVFGTVLFGRMQGGEGADRVMGPFINTLPVRLRVAEEGVEAAVRRAHVLLADLLRHEHASLALAQRCSGVQAPAPLFSSLLNYRYVAGRARPAEEGRAPEDGDGVRGEERTNYPLVLSVNDFGRELGLTAHVQASVEPMRVCALMHTALERLVAALEHAPETALVRLDVLPQDERRRVVEEWNATEAAYPTDRCIHELFAEQAARTPGAVAVAFEGETLTYAELDGRANRLARFLQGEGAGPEVRVGVCAERSPELVVALLGVLKAGAAYVPVDPSYPAERVAHMLRDSGVSVLLTQERLLEPLAAHGVRTVCLDLDWPRIAREPAEAPHGGAGPAHLAYVIYTSGSTGKPKGAMNEHRGVVNRLLWMQEQYGLTPADVVLQKTPFSFDVSVWEFFWPLLTGARLVLARPEGHRDPGYLSELIERAGVTTLHFVPSMLQAFLEAGEPARCGALRRVVCSGEALPYELTERFFERLPHAELHNLYGPTEAAVDVTYWRCAPRADRVVPIGRPVANTRIHVLDAALHPAPVGVPGELYIGGVQVGRGYHARPELTAEKFIPDPFGAPGARLYRTGDRARWLLSGELEYLGRLDQQVKIRGFRIEPGEIEDALLRHPGVREAVVLAREDAPGDRRLVGYYVGDASPDELRAHLSERLPEHMVPAALVALDALPLTPNGKLDRKALPAPEGDAFGAREYEAPLGEVEEALAEVWSEVLRVERVGRRDNFFELGGHSLLAVTLVERMRRRGLHADVRALFATPTLADLAAEVESETREVQVPPNGIPTPCAAITPEMLPLVALSQGEIDAVVAGVPGGAGNVQDVYPLAPLQEGILFHYLMSAEGDPYLTGNLFGFDTRARLDAYLHALRAVVARHDILRTSVAWEGASEPVQVVWREAPLPVEEVALNPADGDVAEQLYARFDPRHYRLDVRRAPMLRVCIAHDVAQDRWVLLLLRHHLVSDHTTLDVLRSEVEAHLEGRAEELPAPLPFRSYVAQARLGVSRAEHEAFFRKLLGDVDEPTAPFGLLDVQGDGSGVAEARLRVDEDLSLRLRESARKLGVSAASLCHVAWAQVLARVSGREDVVFGTVLFGRMQGGEGADRVMGLFINTLPVRLRVAEEGVEAGVRRAHALLADLLRHEHASLALAQRCSGVQAPAPLFSALLNYRHGGSARPAEAPRAPQGMRRIHGEERTNYPLVLSVDDAGQGFWLTTQVHASVEPMRICALMHTALERLTEALEHAPATALGHLDVLPEAERAQVVEVPDPAAAPLPETPVHALVSEQAARTPDAPSLAYGDERVSYAELETRANRLAHFLRKKGVGPEVRVGLLLEPGPELVAAVLAVLRAGGTYVPLDPEHPPARLALALAGAGVRLLLTHTRLAEVLPAEGPERICLDAERERIAREDTHAPEGGAGSANAAYVIYTSGSTGTPKGVMVEHGSLAATLEAARRAFGFAPGERFPALASCAFDIWGFEVLLPLVSGGTVHLLPREEVRDVERLCALLEGVDGVHAVPALMREIVRRVRSGPGTLPGIRRAFVGGDAVAPDLLAEMREAFPSAEVHVLYGPTEGTIICASHAVPEEGARGQMIGRSLPGAVLRVCDAYGAPLPVGVPGELYVGGRGVARGYLERAELTAERWIPDPFGAPGARLYRTGDRARRLSDGTLEFLGRVDRQVKVRGFRIEPGEIEARLSEHPQVREALVLVREDVPGERRLVAYVVGADGEASPAELRAHLSERLPEYMIPAAYVRLDAFPLTPTGKVDRRALPAPQGDALGTGGYEAPLGEVEEALAEVWAEVLGVERVGRRDNFFELGGHSLLAVALIERMRRRGLHADVRALFTTPTLADLAAEVGGETREVQVPPNGIPTPCEAITPEMLPLVELTQEEVDRIVALVPGGAANVQDVYPLAPLQEGILFHYLMAEEGDPYLLASLSSFDSRARLDAYLAALQAVVARHDILRTALAWEGLPEPVQVVWREACLAVEELELDPAEGDVPEQLYERFGPRRYRLDVRQAPMLRVCIAYDAPRERWAFLLLMHHLSGDHTTLDVLRSEVGAHLRGRAEELPTPLPFRSYVAQARLGMGRAEHEAFFRKLLGEVDEPTAPFGLLDVQGDGSGVAEARVMVEEELAVRLRERARALGVSAASVCHLAWAQVLARVSGQEDVVFGTVLFGRMQGGEGADRVMGPFINTLPVRLRVAEEGVEAGVRRAHALLADLLRHEHASLALAQRCSGVQAPAPLFSALLNYRYTAVQGRPAEAREVEGSTRGIRGEERTNYPLVLSVDDFGHGFGLAAQVHAPVEPMRVCALMHTALERLVTALERAPETALVRLDVLPEDERRQVVEEWNNTGAAYPADRCIHELFAEQAARTPGAVAVAFEGETLTYAELDGRANRLARFLQGEGAGPEVRVGVCAERSPELVVALLGVLKAGAAYVPVDPSYPAERVAHMLRDSGVSVLLTQERLLEPLRAHGVRTVCLDRDWPRIAREPAEAPRGGAGPAHLAYVIYTSGSTGQPKGAMNEHRGVVNRLLWMQEAYGLTPADAVLQKTPFSFDVSVWEFFWPLLVGARLVLARPEGHRDPGYLSELIEREGVTTLHFVPSMLQAFLEAGEPARCGALRRVVCSGEALPYELTERFFTQLPHAGLHNLYGPTEAAVDVTYWACERRPDRVVPIGRPVANTRIHVLDAALHPAPVGVPGELYIGGVQVGRGYHARPELTAEKFIPDPFGAPGARLYRTGDRARWLAEGELEYLGRLDQQVKIRGFRIEPGEIEDALLRHAGVREAVVLAREDAPGDRRLVGYYVGDASPDALRAHLSERLPEHMVPAALVALDALPLTPNGKLDRKALPTPELAGTEAYVAPRTALEQVLAESWAEVLGVERVGVHDRFFDLGGHSLLATQVVSRLKALKLEVPVRLFFQAPTVEEMARALVEREPTPGQTERVAALVLRLRSLSPEDRRKLRERAAPGSG